MDAFYASIEQRDNPALKGLPVAVGHSGERGVVASASYEARRYGVRSAMPSRSAFRHCPALIFVPARFDVYRRESSRIMDIFRDYTDRVEPLSLDEAYLDVTVNNYGTPSATLIAKDIKRRIFQTMELTASAGISFNKFLAKVASDYAKPDGLTVIPEAEAADFVDRLPVERFWGVGKVTAKKMHALGIYTGADLRRFTEEDLIRHFGKAGSSYYLNCRAIDNREVISDRVRKSVGCENTFLTDLTEPELLVHHLRMTAEEVWRRAQSRDFYGRTVTLKVKFADFRQLTRSVTCGGFIREYDEFLHSSLSLLAGVVPDGRKVRLLGLSLSNPADIEQPHTIQLKLNFPE